MPVSKPPFWINCVEGAVTVKVMVAVCVIVPEVPVTVTVLVPVVAVDEAVNVKVDVALPLAGGVTGLVEKAAVTPLGRPETLRVVAELNPFWLVTVVVLVALVPCVHAHGIRRIGNREPRGSRSHGEDQVVVVVVGTRGTRRGAALVAELSAHRL